MSAIVTAGLAASTRTGNDLIQAPSSDVDGAAGTIDGEVTPTHGFGKDPSTRSIRQIQDSLQGVIFQTGGEGLKAGGGGNTGGGSLAAAARPPFAHVSTPTSQTKFGKKGSKGGAGGLPSTHLDSATTATESAQGFPGERSNTRVSPGARHSPSRAVGGTVKLAGVFEPALPELDAEAELMASRSAGKPLRGDGEWDDDDIGSSQDDENDVGLLDAAGAMRWVQQLEAFVSEVQAFEQLLAARARRAEADEKETRDRQGPPPGPNAHGTGTTPRATGAALRPDPKPSGVAKERGAERTRSWRPA